MYLEREDNIILKKDQQKRYSDAYQIHDGLLFHYAKGETLWKILEGDCFMATNIRFSNDSKEYRTGLKAIEQFIERDKELVESEKKQIMSSIKAKPMMYYMICFCESGDLLSQWRGYAKDGVSIGLDFTGGYEEGVFEHVEYFCILNNDKYQTLFKNEKKKKYLVNDKALTFVQMPYKVQYVYLGDCISEKHIIDKLTEIWEEGRTEERVDRLMNYIPFVKDEGFKEEAESRLIFDMEFLGESEAHSCKVRSKKIEYLDSNNIKKPFIRVEFGNPEEKYKNVHKVCFGSDVEDLFQRFCELDGKKIDLIFDGGRKGIYVGGGKDQEEIVEWLEKYIELWKVQSQDREQIKIWCEGHLPIRKVIIGPGEKQIDMKESLEHYTNTVYWLRYIDVELSKIPLKG